MKVIIVSQDCYINDTYYRFGDVVQVDDSFDDPTIIKRVVKTKAEKDNQSPGKNKPDKDKGKP